MRVDNEMLVFLKGYDVKGITDPNDMTFRVQSTSQ